MNNEITTEWPAVRAEGYPEMFMYDHNERLRWFPNPETFRAYGYEFGQEEAQPISWFYDKPIVNSIVDVLTGSSYPAEETPNYDLYTGVIVPLLYTCSYCGATFSSQAELNAHIAEAHPVVPIGGIVEWLKTNWKPVAIAGAILAIGITADTLARSRKK